METKNSAHTARGILIGRIETLALGQMDAALSFERRLAAENGWSEVFAIRVAQEYRRFLALIAISNEELTPSDAVDQAWHLHMVYTRDYWQGLCRDIVGRDIHHEPTSGSLEHREHYRGRYAYTLDMYRTTFDDPPPSDIWPDPSERFSNRFQRVDLTRSLVLGAANVQWIGLGVAGLAVTGLLGMNCMSVMLLIGTAIILLSVSTNLKAGTFGRSTRSCSDGCTAGAGCDGGGGSCGGADGGCGGGCGCG